MTVLRAAGIYMITRADISDIILAAVGKDRKTRTVAKRIFLSDWELRRLRKPSGKSISVPRGAIISPLSKDWLEYEGIEVIYDETGR